ncbi:uncharacterized protein YgbK (DUF1537 family) [Halopolyspora algeriensis]|uniref:Uncharacterized protein YgbK (DUF1537 family) n=1 Tax=Halopolyspora algeriensis TaxID=1500506 RepID=A0A368VJA8_9ACTN|nr:four-carbon acid sugar kinase family protein [Halopolyspora algeriensis]RCW40511.1 uncharacterized protein YgbK (DUF1537 family) [Halopolyspora algeriensis]TQM53794.1 uncharacterized protein YgbK (DUF1537 family) [Halopolyspora algeriensis]
MARILVIGDDLTGVNGTGARFARAGLSVATVDPERAASVAQRYNVVVVNTDSRHLDPAAAAARVAEAVREAGPVELVVKRTDSTLRGNVGAEVEAALTAVRAGTDRPVRGLMVPAFPDAARVTVDGVQLLDGVPLERTELAGDPLNPMRTSVVADIVADQTTLALRHVPLRRVTADGPALTEALAAGTEPLVLCDAFADDHIDAITHAAAEVSRRDGTVWVSVDPGPAGASLARALSIQARTCTAGPLLAVVGSATELTRRQLDVVQRHEQALFLDLNVHTLVRGATGGFEQDLVAALRERSFPEIVVLRTAASAAGVIDLDATDRQRVPRMLAELVERTVRAAPVSGVYTTGGDVTAAVLTASGSQAFEVTDEVVPLAVRGSVVGGALDGLPAATKGGLVGDENTAQQCLRQLRSMVEQQLRRIRSDVPGFDHESGDPMWGNQEERHE